MSDPEPHVDPDDDEEADENVSDPLDPNEPDEN